MAAALAVLTVMACAAAPMPDEMTRRPFDVQGHRGARGLLPENTLEAFERALELGVSTLELDLGVTRDRQVVVSHDRRINPKLCRHADGTPITDPPLLRDVTLSEVQAYDCGGLNPDRDHFPEPPRRNVAGARIPTLAEVFELAAATGDGEIRFNVETKIDPTVDDTVPLEDFVALVIGIVRQHDIGERVTVQSFEWRALELVKAEDPTLETVALLSPETLDPAWLNGLDPGSGPLGLLRAARSYVDVFSPYWRMVAPGSPQYRDSSVEEIQAAGFPVVPWTVNRRRQMEKMLALGVDGLITDYPDVLVDLLREQGVPIL
ncbi:MAG: glycerophosphodiester phosphodiesterase [bacterium]|nr:glycerophosphodiester phosphodiesterase [bacterium]